jgi:hypothetical protein
LGVLFDWHPPRYIPPHSTFFFFFFFENQQEKERKTKGDFDGSSSFTIYDSSSSAPFSLSSLLGCVQQLSGARLGTKEEG